MLMRPLLLLVAAVQGGCSMLYGVEHLAGTASSDWYPVGPVQKPLPEVLAMTRDVMVRQGYVVAAPAAEARRLESGWDVHLSSHWREGMRSKLEAEVEDARGGGFVLRVRTQTELNNNSKQPLSLDQAQWIGASLDAKWDDRMNDSALRFQTMLKLKFFGLGP